MQHRVASPWLAGARKAKPRNAREKARRSKATPGKARKHNTAQHNTGVKIGIAVGASRDSLRSPRSALTQQKHAKNNKKLTKNNPKRQNTSKIAPSQRMSNLAGQAKASPSYLRVRQRRRRRGTDFELECKLAT